MQNSLYTPASPDPRLAQYLTDYPAGIFTEQLYRSVALAHGYATAHALQLLSQLGVGEQLADWVSAEEVRQRLAFSPRFSQALTWLLAMAVEANVLQRQEDNYRLAEPLTKINTPSLAELRATGLTIDPANAATLDLLDVAAAAYPDVANGRRRGEQALFGMGQLNLWQAYFNNQQPLYAVNNWVSATAAALRLADQPPSGKQWRLLEIGAGAGSGAEALLQLLAERGLTRGIERYVITEPNAFFRRRGERALKAAYPDVPLEFRALDINRPWREQLPDHTSGGFDLIYGVNVLHVAKDLLFSLAQARSCLASDGWLIAGECLRPFPGQPIYAELMFQILDGYFEVQTHPEFRPNGGFLTPEQWLKALAKAGFGQRYIAPDPVPIRDIYRHFFTGALCAK